MKHTQWLVNGHDIVTVQNRNGDDGVRQLIATVCDKEDVTLIAAAPELLRAAQTAVSLIRGSGYTENTKALTELLSAIAKAEGAK